jgi:hypothetical protein
MSKENSEKIKDKKSSAITASNKENKQPDDKNRDEILGEIIKDAPQEFKRNVQSFLGMIQSRSQVNPIVEKFTEAHVDKYLDYVQRDYDNEYRLKSTNRWFILGYVVAALSFLVFLIVYLLLNNKEFLSKILEILAYFGGGFGAGYGVKTFKSRKL